jgi:hypothetical protein
MRSGNAARAPNVIAKATAPKAGRWGSKTVPMARTATRPREASAGRIRRLTGGTTGSAGRLSTSGRFRASMLSDVREPTLISHYVCLSVPEHSRQDPTTTARARARSGRKREPQGVGLAVMNMILHGRATAEIAQGDVLADPQFIGPDGLRDFCVG